MQSKAICILGMHRSGTSVITRAINLLGVDLGDESGLMLPADDNPKGFWERQDIADLNDKILDHFKRSWDSTLPLSEGWFKSEDIVPLRNEIAGLVVRTFSETKLWAWKDPRTTVLFDLWQDVLKELDVELSCLFAVRNPLDVARSLEKRDGILLDKGFGLWFNYNIVALKAYCGLQRVFLSYDSFLENWQGELNRCAEALDIEWPLDDTYLKEEMKNFIRPGLRHSFSSLKELKEACAPRPVVELYELLQGVMDGSKEAGADFEVTVDRLYNDFISYANFFKDDVEKGTVAIHRLDSLEVLLADKDRQIDELSRQISVLQESEAEKDAQTAEKERLILALKSSFSWRITAPLRALAGLLIKPRNK